MVLFILCCRPLTLPLQTNEDANGANDDTPEVIKSRSIAESRKAIIAKENSILISLLK